MLHNKSAVKWTKLWKWIIGDFTKLVFVMGVLDCIRLCGCSYSFVPSLCKQYSNCAHGLYQNQCFQMFSYFQLCLITVLPLLRLAAESLGTSVSAELAWHLYCPQCSFHELPRRKFEQTILTFVGSCWPIPRTDSCYHGNVDLPCKLAAGCSSDGAQSPH